MSLGTENPATVKKRNAQPARSKLRSHGGALYQKQNPDKAHQATQRWKNRTGGIAEQLEKAFDPLIIDSDNIILSCDWHVPFHNEELIEQLLTVAKERGTKHLAIIGDLWDCDSVSSFNHLVSTKERITFEGEQEEVKKILKRLLNVFETIYICAGNHEYRWCAITSGNADVKSLYKLALPAAFEGGKFEGRIRITNDDHMILRQDGKEWLLCHPRSFRQTPLSVVRDLASIWHMNVCGAHGHQNNQGRDKSGKYICIDGGGLFDRKALEYARRTSCHPMTRSGFYLLKDGILTPFEGPA